MIELQARRIAVYLADVHAPVREFAARAGLPELLADDRLFATLDLAVNFIEENLVYI